MTTFDIHADEALAVVAEDQAAAAARDARAERLLDPRREEVTVSGRLILRPSMWPSVHQPRRISLLRWQWRLTDHETGDELATGTALTERWAWTSAGREAQRIHEQRWAQLRTADVGERLGSGVES